MSTRLPGRQKSRRKGGPRDALTRDAGDDVVMPDISRGSHVPERRKWIPGRFQRPALEPHLLGNQHDSFRYSCPGPDDESRNGYRADITAGIPPAQPRR